MKKDKKPSSGKKNEKPDIVKSDKVPASDPSTAPGDLPVPSVQKTKKAGKPGKVSREDIQKQKHAFDQQQYRVKKSFEKKEIKKSEFNKKIADIKKAKQQFIKDNPFKRKVNKKSFANIKKYNQVQSLLSHKLHEENTSLDSGKFREKAKEIYANVGEYDRKGLEIDFDRIYLEYVGEYDFQHSEKIPFYNAMAEFTAPDYDDYEISLDWGPYDFKGNGEDFSKWFVDGGLYSYLRTNHNDSDSMAHLVLVKEDENKKTLKYTIQTPDNFIPEFFDDDDQPEPEFPETEIKGGGPSRKSDKDSELDILNAKKEIEQIALEKAKIDLELKQAEIRLQELKQSSAEKALELHRAGFSTDDIKKILGI